MIKLSKEQIVSILSILISKTGGVDGIRDNGLVESAINLPFQTFDGEELYPTVFEKAACLCYGLVNNHPFLDGNKRIGILAILTFLEINKVIVTVTDGELIRLGLDIASGKMNQYQICEWIILHDEQ